MMKVNRNIQTHLQRLCHETDFCGQGKILHLNQELKEDLPMNYRKLGEKNYS